MLIKTLRIHYEPEIEDYEYTLFDRHGKFYKKVKCPIYIEDLPPVKYFGFCPNETVDVTLEFEKPIDSKKIIYNRE